VAKNVVLGVVSTKDAKMESMEELLRKVNSTAVVIAKGQGRAREAVVRDSLGVSPQCGFASRSPGGGVGMTKDKSE
jgi:methionine synthase II (cobalamin-independent)